MLNAALGEQQVLRQQTGDQRTQQQGELTVCSPQQGGTLILEESTVIYKIPTASTCIKMHFVFF